MDHPCPSCGVAVADGTPFCSSCRAPQIRFVPLEPAQPLERHENPSDDVLLPTGPLVWRSAVPAAFLGGIFSALAMKFLFGLLGLGFIGGGIIAVYAYRRRVPGAVLGLGAGSLLGALSGFLGFLVVSVLVGIQVMLTNKGEEFRRTAFESMDKTVQNADPQLQRQFQEAVLRFKTPEGFIFFIVLGCVFLLAAFVFFSVLGGAIGASISRRKLK